MSGTKAIITCALTGVLTNPKQYPVPVTPEQMAREARAAFDAGAAIMHVHFRQQAPDMGHLPSWEPAVAIEIMDAIKDSCPGVILNQSTGQRGPNISGPLACLRAVRPEIAAANAGSLNYLKIRADGSWAWPPGIFDNAPDKLKQFLDVMVETETQPEFECFDTGIVRSVDMFVRNGMYRGTPKYNFVMGVASGMPGDPELLPLLLKLIRPGSPWQITAIGRDEIWHLHRRSAELGGHLRTGLEDTFYLPNGSKARSNGELIAAIAETARSAGRSIASPIEARAIMGLKAASG
ncbi:MAG: 3-keto-5-aminohexanoate cleavage protein [Hyphomicrobiaceae bacterium]|nr:3-keto-5-aminohexanoate cleavage protein [Hyphomicrobiaceae bacterium]